MPQWALHTVQPSNKTAYVLRNYANFRGCNLKGNKKEYNESGS